ncbi:MAG: hypothetical protein K2H13_06580 [Eubacterium sp.]|nr:hypothetical protein [Eubacterium sp.]MDE6155575.1 hypothetical protein [Eubacterium sp.]
MEKNKKKKIKIISILAAILVVIIVLSSVIAANQFRIKSELLYYVMPDSIEMELNNDSMLELYKRKNENYDYKTQKDNPLAAFEFYYYDENGDEVVVNGDNPIMIDGEVQGAPTMAFILSSSDKLNHIKKVATIVSCLVILIITVALIFIWYRVWCKKQDEEKERKYGRKNENNHKKKKK